MLMPNTRYSINIWKMKFNIKICVNVPLDFPFFRPKIKYYLALYLYAQHFLNGYISLLDVTA